MNNPFPDDPIVAAQFFRAVGHVSSGGAEIGECYATGTRVARRGGALLEAWFEEWCKLGDRLARQGEECASKDHRVSALSCYLRASNYYRTAYTFHLGIQPLPSEALDAYRRHCTMFETAATMMTSRVEVVQIDYPEGKGKKLRGYLFHPLAEITTSAVPPPPSELVADDVSGTNRTTTRKYPLLIVNGGYDSTSEECYFYGVSAALARGYCCLTFDGPGQGRAVMEDGLYFREDWEVVVRRVVDYAVTRTDAGVDVTRIALMGVSFGGYLAPRAASGEERISALIADPGQYSLLEGLKARLPSFMLDAVFAERPSLMTNFVDFLLLGRAKNPTKGWAIRRGLFVHG